MAKFYGNVAYGVTEQTSPGVWEKRIMTRKYRGDVLRPNTRRLAATENVNDNLKVTNVISVMADAYAYLHFTDIQYIEWMGVKWKVETAEVRRPRIDLTLGGMWNENAT